MSELVFCTKHTNKDLQEKDYALFYSEQHRHRKNAKVLLIIL